MEDYLKKVSEIDSEITKAIAQAIELNEEISNSGEMSEGSEAWKNYSNVEHNLNNALAFATRACTVMKLQAILRDEETGVALDPQKVKSILTLEFLEPYE